MDIKEINELLIDLSLLHCTDYSKLYLKHLSTKINFYNKQLDLLKSEKPFWFQKKKIKKYNELINSYQNKIIDCYAQMNDELNFILNINNKNS